MGKKQDKTNVMRVLDQKKIDYKCFAYDNSKLSAVEVAESLNIKVEMLFKTLVTVGKSKDYYVFMVPAEKELDLKKAARVAGEKSIEMIHQKDLLPLTGYIHGGCSPIGMKRQFKTFIDLSATNEDTLFFSAGKVGHQVCMTLQSLQKVIPVIPYDIVKD